VRYDRGTTGGVVVDLAAGTADDADGSGNSGHDVLLNIENVRGSNFDDTISGDGGSNQLDGRDGNDILIGGGGGDRFIGGGGDDSIVGGSGADTFQFDLASPAGNDTVSNFDRSVDVLSFNDVVDQGAPGLDLDDLTAAISGITDNGLGGNVVVGFDNGASITFAGVGTGSIASIQDLVDDPNSQIAVA
jgi:Ca2+-binding RTX toxin-like protein